MAYADPATISDETLVAEACLTGVADRVPGWVPYEGHTEVALSESVGIAIATAVTSMKATAQETYVGFGQAVLGIQKIRATAAETTCTVILTADQAVMGMELDAGSEFYATSPTGDAIAFYTTAGTVIAPGQGTAAGITLIAQLTGPEANDTAGDATSTNSGIQQVTFDAPAAGGVDDETDAAYASRLAARTPRMHVLPITVADYAELARDVAGVAARTPSTCTTLPPPAPSAPAT